MTEPIATKEQAFEAMQTAFQAAKPALLFFATEFAENVKLGAQVLTDFAKAQIRKQMGEN